MRVFQMKNVQVLLIKKPMWAAVTIAIIAIAMTYSCARSHPSAPKTGLYLPECVILQSTQAKPDPNIEAYKNVLNAVALNWRMESVDRIERLAISENPLLLIIPMRTANSLTPAQIQGILSLVESGAVLVSEGMTPLSEKLGVRPGKPLTIQHLRETAYSDVEINWEKAERVTPLQGPEGTLVLNYEPSSRAPMTCLISRGRGKCLLLAAELDPVNGEGYARFPYFLHELQRAGVHFAFRSNRLSAFFDYGYRYKESPDRLAKVWRATGIQALHVGTWDFFDEDSGGEMYLDQLIDACHRNGILVYGWLELPHVSTGFWKKHPEWREKTADGKDAHVDWRYVMNLNDPKSYQAIAEGLERLFRRYDWDGVNLSELYFDCPSGPSSPELFTPFNSYVRSEFKQLTGIDPFDYFKKESPYYWKKNPSDWKKFVEYRVTLERDLNEKFIKLLSGFRSSFKPDLDIVVTYVDNIYDPSMREGVGADVGVMFELLDRHDFTLILEDPGTVWHLGPRRYAELAQTYSKMTRHAGKLGTDINIVDRDVKAYPTSKQTGSEFLELFYHAGRNFQTVMVYGEQTMLPQDAELVSHALAPEIHTEIVNQGIRMSASMPFVYRYGADLQSFEVDGQPWPCVDIGEVSLPAGSYLLSRSQSGGMQRPRLVKLNGNLEGARYIDDRTIEFRYSSHRRVISIFNNKPNTLQVDGGTATEASGDWILLPRGSHKVRATFPRGQ
jgi:hypothetical protein